MNVKLRIVAPRHQPWGLFLFFLLLLPVTTLLVSWRPSVAPADAPNAPHAPEAVVQREFYLSVAPLAAKSATQACAAGYHFASLWEVADVSKLKYNTELGYKTADSGSGPPTVAGWIRTGGDDANSSQIAGTTNCNLWTSSDKSAFGSVAGLATAWESNAGVVSFWDPGVSACSVQRRVWCVENEFPNVGEAYLPMIQLNAVQQ